MFTGLFDKLKAYFAGNPVRVRSAVLAVAAFLTPYVPQIADVVGNEAIVGGLVALIVLVLGEGAQRKEDAKTDAAGKAATETE